jgi:hypothetical protein
MNLVTARRCATSIVCIRSPVPIGTPPHGHRRVVIAGLLRLSNRSLCPPLIPSTRVAVLGLQLSESFDSRECQRTILAAAGVPLLVGRNT